MQMGHCRHGSSSWLWHYLCWQALKCNLGFKCLFCNFGQTVEIFDKDGHNTVCLFGEPPLPLGKRPGVADSSWLMRRHCPGSVAVRSLPHCSDARRGFGLQENWETVVIESICCNSKYAVSAFPVSVFVTMSWKPFNLASANVLKQVMLWSMLTMSSALIQIQNGECGTGTA